MDKRILFRADASLEIGIGHITRCLVLAEILEKNFFEIEFIVKNQDGNFVEKILNAGYKVNLISAESLEQDREETINLLERDDIVIVDHYGIDIGWEKPIRETIKRLIVIDDLGDREHFCDALIDPTFGDCSKKYEKLVPHQCICLVGERYTMLRDEFIDKKVLNQKRDEIVVHVFFGGVDFYDYSSKYSKILLQHLRESKVILVVGIGYSNVKELRRIKEIYPNRFDWYQNVDNMAKYMLEADIAIGAPGNATWERMALGLPSLYLATNKNQVDILKKLEFLNLAIFLGMANEVSEKQFIETVGGFIVNTDFQESMRKRIRKAIDGGGKDRIVEVIMKLCGGNK